MPLPLRRHADRDEHLARGLDVDAGALVEFAARDLHVERHAETELPSARFHLGALPLEVVEPDKAQRLVKQPRRVARVVDHRARVLVDRPRRIRELLVANQVPAAHLRPVEVELLRDRVEQPLHQEAGLRLAGAAVGRRRHRVRVQDPPCAAVRPHLVGAGHEVRRDQRQDDAVRDVGACVEKPAVVDAEDVALVVERDADVVLLPALVVRADEVLAPVLHPLDGAPEPD